MSSLEEDVFFGSRQNALDSYLKARERKREEEQPRKGIVYPNILDEISYQKSFDRQVSQTSQLHRFNSIVKGSDISLLNESVNILFEQVIVKDNSIKQGSCLQVKISLGAISISELVFFSPQPHNLQSPLAIQPTQQSITQYFQQLKAKYLKIDIKNLSNQDRPVGAAFLPAQTLLLLLSTFFQTRQDIAKPISLKISKNSKIELTLKITKEVSIRSISKKQEEVLTEKQKCSILIEDFSLTGSFTLQYEGKTCLLQKGAQFCIDVERSAKSLNEGITFKILDQAATIGIITIAAIPLFLNQSSQGTYVVCHPETMQYVGSITLSIHQKIISTTIRKQKQTTIKPVQTQAIFISINNIFLYTKQPAEKYRLLCYLDSIVKSFIVSFEFVHANVYVLSEPIQMAFQQSKQMQFSMQLYEVGQQYDTIVSHTEVKLGFPMTAGLFWVDQQLDSKSDQIVKFDVSVGLIRDVAKSPIVPISLFYNRYRIQPGDLKEQMRKILNITHLEADRIMGLCSQDFLQRFQSRQKGIKIDINACQLSRQLEYADMDKTGYVSKQVMGKILSYFNITADVMTDFIVKQDQWISDRVYGSRDRAKEECVSYLPLLVSCVGNGMNRQQPSGNTLSAESPIQQPPITPSQIAFVIVNCTNLNTLSKIAPNSYIVQPDSNQTTPVKYRDCNPQFHTQFRLRNWTKHSIQLILMHKDLKSKDMELTRVFVSTNRLQMAQYSERIKIQINPNSNLIIQKH